MVLMRCSRPILSVLLAGLAALAAAAPPPAPDATSLSDLVTSYEQAIRGGDIPKSGIRQRLAPGFTAALPSGELINGYGELSKAENALRTMVGRGTRYETIDVQVDPAIEADGNLAVLTGRTVNRATAQAGKSLAYTTQWTAVALKEAGGWRLLRHQAVMDPATNPWHTEEAGGPGWLMVAAGTLAGGLAGLMVGFALAKVLGRRPTPAPPTAAGGTRARSWESSSAPAAPAATAQDQPVPEKPSSSRSWHAPAAATEPEPPKQADPPPEKPARKRSWES